MDNWEPAQKQPWLGLVQPGFQFESWCFSWAELVDVLVSLLSGGIVYSSFYEKFVTWKVCKEFNNK